MIGFKNKLGQNGFSARRVIAAAKRMAIDADAADYISRAEALGGSFDATAINATYTEAYNKAAIAALVKALKGDPAALGNLTTALPGTITASDLWTTDKIVEMYALATGVSFSGLMAKLKYDSVATMTNIGFVTGDYVAAGSGAGLTGDRSSYLSPSLLDTDFDPADLSMGYYNTSTVESSTVVANVIYGSSADPKRFNFFEYSNSVRSDIGVFSTGRMTSVATTGGFFIRTARSFTDSEHYIDGISNVIKTSDNSAASFGGNSVVLLSKSGSGGTAASIASIFLGGGLDDVEAAYLSWCINAHATAMGCNVYANPT